MSDDRDRDADLRPEDDGEDQEEPKGLGLTEEFARLESEIEGEAGPRRRVRFDETDSGEWVAPIERSAGDVGRETDEWAAPQGLGEIEEEEEAEQPQATDDDAGEGDDAGSGPEPVEAKAEPAAELDDAAAEKPQDAAAEKPEDDGSEDPETEPEDDGPEDDGSEDPETEPEDDGPEPVAEVAPDSAAASAGDVSTSPDPSADDADSTPAADSEEGVHDGVPDSPTKQPEPELEPQQVAAQAADAPAAEHTVIRDRTSGTRPIPAGGGGYGLPPIDDDDIKDRTPALWWRFMTGSVMIVVAVATAVALSGLLAFNGLANSFQPIRGLPVGGLPEVEPGEPFTIMIVGSDKRSNTPGDPGRSDTTMLLRVDAQDSVLSLFSLPRDLKVDIAGKNFGPAKLNEAYTDGGVKKTLATVQNLTGLKVNYVVNVDFQGFADAVDAIGCVYVDVDRKYFNDNSTAVSAEDQYAAIDVNAGYQRLCGQNALDYVRYRHTDSDFVRAARQQDFLRNARAQVPVREVLPIVGGDTSNELLDIFTDYTSTTINTPAQLISVLRSFIAIKDVSINEVHFNGSDTLENGVSYVTATDSQIEKAVAEFLGDEDSSGGPDSGPASRNEGEDKDKAKKKKKDKSKSGGSDSSKADVTSTADNAGACGGVDKIPAFGRTSARRLKFPVYIPTVMVPGSCYASDSRQYEIKDTDENKRPAYKLVIPLNSTTAAGEYYGVEGTEWGDAPILAKKSETITKGNRDYDLYYDGDRLRIVAFHVGDNAYWVSNTLLQTLSDDQMLAIAQSMVEAK